jgi:acyl carrier protein
MWCEAAYGIEITDSEAENLKTISDFARLVDKKKVVCLFPST